MPGIFTGTLCLTPRCELAGVIAGLASPVPPPGERRDPGTLGLGTFTGAFGNVVFKLGLFFKF